MRSVISFVCVLFVLFWAFPACHVSASVTPDTSAASFVLYHPASGAFLAEKNADERRPIASTTKIMTALTVLSCGELDRKVRIPKEAVGIEGSSLYLKENEVLSRLELLYGLLLASANDAATALAIDCAGSVDAFADRMNGLAATLGLSDTHFTNPHGLDDPSHYSTARDLSKISAAALENEVFRKIVSTKRFVIPAPDGGKRWLVNHNKLLSNYPDCVGVKTGFTKKSGRCLVSCAERDGVTLIAVTLNAPDDWRDHKALLDFGFASIKKTTLLPARSLSINLPVVNGLTSNVTLTNSEEIEAALPTGAPEPEREILLPHFLPAPLKEGEIVGYVTFTLNGVLIGQSPLTVNESIGEMKYKKGLFH